MIFDKFNDRGFFRFVPTKLMVKIQFRLVMKKKLNLDNPTTWNEKIQYIKVYDHNAIYPSLVDKYEVRNYIKNKIGSEYLIPIYGVYNKITDVDFTKLPNQFVIKCTHDSGSVRIIRNKKDMDLYEVIKFFNKKMKRNYYYHSREWAYKNVRPRIIIEKLMEDNESEYLRDYKFFCFGGNPKYIQIDYDRFSNHTRNVYEINGNKINSDLMHPRNLNNDLKIDDNIREMIGLCSIISPCNAFSRIDFYLINNHIYFGEITLYHGSGYEFFSDDRYNELFGNLIDLTKIKKGV